MTTNLKTKGWFNPFSLSVLIVLIVISVGFYVLDIVPLSIFLLLLVVSALISASIRIADQWERAVVLRIGKYQGLKGPGSFVMNQTIDHVSTYIYQRVRVRTCKAEQSLTKDTVTVNAAAVVYWTQGIR